MRIDEAIEQIHKIARSAGLDIYAKELNWHNIHIKWYTDRNKLNLLEGVYHLNKAIKYTKQIVTELGHNYKELLPDLNQLIERIEQVKSKLIIQNSNTVEHMENHIRHVNQTTNT